MQTCRLRRSFREAGHGRSSDCATKAAARPRGTHGSLLPSVFHGAAAVRDGISALLGAPQFSTRLVSSTRQGTIRLCASDASGTRRISQELHCCCAPDCAPRDGSRRLDCSRIAADRRRARQEDPIAATAGAMTVCGEIGFRDARPATHRAGREDGRLGNLKKFGTVRA